MSLPLRDLRVAVLGTGRVATSLGASLTAAGAQTAVRSARGDLDTADVDLVLIAVTDAALETVVARLEPRPGQVVAHTSGRHGLAVLATVRTHGAAALAFHPAMPFDGTPVDLRGSCIGLTADPEALALAERLCAALGASPVWLAENQRDLYHAALCHSANHLVTLLAEAMELLGAAGVRAPAAVLEPLTRAALRSVLERGDAATTGPVVRGDTATVAAHLAAVARVAPDSVDSYRVLARETARRGVRRGVLSPEQADDLAVTLGRPVQVSA